ncbi:MAG: TetR/AcrR family transcriptional regulator, partial [Desulfovermiculus sp.]
MGTKEYEDLHETAQIILREAHELFYEKGYEKASMREISERVGISKAAMYHHFTNKEEILYTICLQAGNLVYDNLQQAILRNEDLNVPVQDQLTDILFEYTTSYLKNKNFNKILLHDIESLPEDKKRVILDIEKANVNQLRAYLHELMRRGRLRECDLTVLTFSLFSAVHWLYFWYRPGKELSVKKIVENIVDIYTKGILSDEEARV